MSDSFFDNDTARNEGVGFNLDIKRVISRAIRFWYLILLSLLVTLAFAFYTNRYTERVYPVNASIVIREVQETGGAELLYKNALIDPYRNYLNEPYIIRSVPLIEKVIRDLDFQITFLREGYVITTEAYDYVPVKATWCNPNSVKTGSLVFTLLDEKHYTLQYLSDKSGATHQYLMGDSVSFDNFHLCINLLPDRKPARYFGVPFIMTVSSATSMAVSYTSRLSVDWAEQGAGVINLGLTGTNPQKEIDFLTALISEYGQQDLDKKNETATRTIEFIQTQLIEIKDSLREVEFQLERFGSSSRMKDMSEEAQRLIVKDEAFEVEKAELLIRQNYFDYLEAYMKREDNNLDQVVLPSSVGLSDPVLSGLISNLMESQLDVRMYLGKEDTRNPLAITQLEKIANVKKDILEAIRSLRSTDKIKMDFLKKESKDIETQLKKLPASERQLVSVQRNYSLLENLYVFLMQKLSEARISKASNTSDIILVNPPRRGGPLSPKPGRNYMVAAVTGIAIPLILFILFEVINNKVQSKEDIEKMSAIPFIGGVGHNTSGNNLTVSSKSKSGIAESFRALRSNLNFFTNNESRKVFMVSSSISGEGKTFTTINLSTVFAMSDKKTLIVGADMRRPKIYEDFNLHNDTGLSTYLSGYSTFEEIVQATAIPNLFMVSGGPVPPNPSELLLTERFETFIKKSLDEFEFVIIDTPPMALVTDAFVISQYVDHTVFVVRQNYTPKQFVRSIDEYHRNGKLKSISILLNDIYKSGLGYGYGQGYAYYYGYSYGYGYGKRKNGQGYYEE